MGFYPGSQAAGGQWEGMAVDKEVVDYIQDSDYGGIMFWAINEVGTSAIKTGLSVNEIAMYAKTKFKNANGQCKTPSTKPVDPPKKQTLK